MMENVVWHDVSECILQVALTKIKYWYNMYSMVISIIIKSTEYPVVT